MLPTSDDGISELISLSIQFALYGACMNGLWVNTNGLISFDGQNKNYYFNPFDSSRYVYPVVASLLCDADTTQNDGQVYYRESTEAAILEQATNDVADGTTFSATSVFIATWHNVTYHTATSTSGGTPTNTFQTVLVSDGNTSFVIFNYGEITWTKPLNVGSVFVKAGVNAGDGTHYFSLPGSGTAAIADLQNSTNVGTTGRWIFRVDGETGTCQDEFGQSISAPAHFYPYGTGVGDFIIRKRDTQSSGQFSASTPFVLYGTSYNKLWRATNDVADRTGFTATWVFIATWQNVTYYDGDNDSPRNTFQVVMISDGDTSYVIFNYGEINWTIGADSDMHAVGGVNAGDGINYISLPGSGTAMFGNLQNTTNDGTNGRWHFRVDCENNTICIDECASDPCHNGGSCADKVNGFSCTCVVGFMGENCDTRWYDCADHSPCTAANRAQGKYFFIHSDVTKYVRCSAFGCCWVRPCAPSTVFNEVASVCTRTRG